MSKAFTPSSPAHMRTAVPSRAGHAGCLGALQHSTGCFEGTTHTEVLVRHLTRGSTVGSAVWGRGLRVPNAAIDPHLYTQNLPQSLCLEPFITLLKENASQG